MSVVSRDVTGRDWTVGDRVLIPYLGGYPGTVVRLYPAESTCAPTASVAYDPDTPYAGHTWGGYQSALKALTPAAEKPYVPGASGAFYMALGYAKQISEKGHGDDLATLQRLLAYVLDLGRQVDA